MNEVSRTRLIVLRITYAIIAIGQVLFFWPKLLSHSHEWALTFGDAGALFAGMSILMALGIRYPLKMLPILVFEFAWKCIWLIAIYAPLARAGRVDAATSESLVNVGVGVVICFLAIPWGYVVRKYFKDSPDRIAQPGTNP